ncbi:MAG TPA: cupin domain-containing protein [Longimicrobiaceae bacterium]|nr:cupin domain-containing protein [Longimicrobiaceae bacterium]
MNDDAVLDLRSVFGVRARVTVPASATGGAYVEMDCTAEPGAGTMVHYHPGQEESFRVLEGSLEVLREGRWSAVRAGETHTVPEGAVHAWRNSGGAPVRFLNVHRPALGFQAHMETLDRLAKAGKVRGKSDPRSLVYMSMSAVEHRPDVTVKPPQWVVNAMAWIGRRLGFTLDA